MKRGAPKRVGRPSRKRSINLIGVKKYQRSKRGLEVIRRYRNSKRFKEHVRKYKRIWSKGLSKTEQSKARKELDNFNGRCHACKSRKTSKVGWHLDHKGKKFRGILCHKCNVALGFVRDSIVRLLKLVKYLRKTR